MLTSEIYFEETKEDQFLITH